MEEYLTQLYNKDGVAIFHTDYQLFLKLLDKYSDGPLRNDVYCIQVILGGNALYKSITEACKNGGHEVSRAEYNVFIAQMYSHERFWKCESDEPAHMEYLLRMLYRVAGIDISGIPVKILSEEPKIDDKEVILNELTSAVAAYKNKYYRAAFEKSKTLFENGVGSSAVLLSMAYFNGHGTHIDYNKALFYLTYPHEKTRLQDKEERNMLDRLLELRDKSMYSSIVCSVGSVLVFLFMLVDGFFNEHLGLALFNTALLAAGVALFVIAYKRKLIFDFSYWFLVLGFMFLIILIL